MSSEAQVISSSKASVSLHSRPGPERQLDVTAGGVAPSYIAWGKTVRQVECRLQHGEKDADLFQATTKITGTRKTRSIYRGLKQLLFSLRT